MTDTFARAVHDHQFGEQSGPLQYRNGERTKEADVSMYFEEYAPEGHDWLASWLDGPLLDIGAGAGRHALYFQERFETVAIEQTDLLVEVLRDRGVDDARRADMFALPESFERDRFASALAIGTQTGLSRSMRS